MSLLGSVIKPDKHNNHTARTVHMGPAQERAYEFKDSNNDGHYVAAVTDPDDAAALLATGHFYPYNPKAKDAAPFNPEPRVATSGQIQSVPVTEAFMPDVLEEAQQILLLTPAKLSIQLGKVSLAVVRAALHIETKDGKPRPAIEKLLRDTLEMAAQANSKA